MADEIPVGELDYSDGSLTPEEWARFVAYCFRDELNDRREDIYTHEDGTPSRPTGSEEV